MPRPGQASLLTLTHLETLATLLAKQQAMKRFFAPNIDAKGRLVRGLMGLGLLAGAAFAFAESVWLAALLGAAGVFGLFEALRGWCLVRACRIKTKL